MEDVPLAAGALGVLMSLQKGLCHAMLLGNAPEPARRGGQSEHQEQQWLACLLLLC